MKLHKTHGPKPYLPGTKHAARHEIMFPWLLSACILGLNAGLFFFLHSGECRQTEIPHHPLTSFEVGEAPEGAEYGEVVDYRVLYFSTRVDAACAEVGRVAEGSTWQFDGTGRAMALLSVPNLCGFML